MKNSKVKSLTGHIQLLLKNNWDFPQKLKQRLVLESNNVINPFKFIAGMLTQGVLSDGSSDPEASFGLKEIMVQLAITIACSKGADAIGGLIRALEESGNSQLISALRTWAKQEFGIEIYGKSSEPKEAAAAVPAPPTGKLSKDLISPSESSSVGTRLIDKVTSRVEDYFMEELEGHLVSKASEIVNTAEFCTSLVHQNKLEETDIRLAAGPEVQLTEKAIKAVCSKKAMGSLVVALQSSNNECILAEIYGWLETKKNYPISVKSLGRQPRPTGPGLFAATEGGLIALDLQTLQAKALTNKHTFAVAVNHKLKKVYWAEGWDNSRIMRANFDGSAEEIIVPQTGDDVRMLAIEEASGNVYFNTLKSHQITVCNALGKNRAAVISNSSLVAESLSIALDSKNGVMYWGNRQLSRRWSNPHSLVRANLDGINPTIISTGFSGLTGITLDEGSNNVIYWADYLEHTIGTTDVIGGNKRTLVKLEGNQGPWGIQVDANKIYFSNRQGGNIQSVDRYSGRELTTIFSSPRIVRHLALFNAPT